VRPIQAYFPSKIVRAVSKPPTSAATSLSADNQVLVAARAAMADSRGAAHALARFVARPALVVPDRESPDRIRPLPIAALRLPQDTVDNLRRLGFERISDLLATPRAPLTLRFGLELGRRLDQATGHTGEPIEPVRPPESLRPSSFSPNRSALRKPLRGMWLS
jgi:nucleotidyltransferase/DNA polymerase involved in DNA repair